MNRAPLLRRLSSTVVLATVLCVGCVSTQTPAITDASRLPKGQAAPPKVHRFEHVFTIVLENQDYGDVIKDHNLGPLALSGASFTDFHGLFHPSYDNYLAMVSGRLIETHGDKQVKLDFVTIGDRLVTQGRTWKNYAEGYPGQPGQCFLADGHDRYARKHVPFLSFVQVQKSGCANVVPDTQLAEDLQAGNLPTYAFYSPDLDDDGHDPTSDPPKGLAKASAWLKKFREDHAFPHDTLVVVTFDESKGTGAANQIYTVFLGDMVTPGCKVAMVSNHLNVLRTIEDNFGLEPLADGDGNARPITECWK